MMQKSLGIPTKETSQVLGENKLFVLEFAPSIFVSTLFVFVYEPRALCLNIQ